MCLVVMNGVRSEAGLSVTKALRPGEMSAGSVLHLIRILRSIAHFTLTITISKDIDLRL